MIHTQILQSTQMSAIQNVVHRAMETGHRCVVGSGDFLYIVLVRLNYFFILSLHYIAHLQNNCFKDVRFSFFLESPTVIQVVQIQMFARLALFL